MRAGRFEVRHDAAGASSARRRLTDELSKIGTDPDVIADVVLVASELVTNAVRHTSGDDELVVSWELTAGAVLISVGDDSVTAPVLRAPRSDDPGGRGLPIVAALAADWGVTPGTGSGKLVWARISLR